MTATQKNVRFARSRGKCVASAIQDQRKMIRQVLNIACGRQASAAVENIPKELERFPVGLRQSLHRHGRACAGHPCLAHCI
jgi:hypothetical protein